MGGSNLPQQQQIPANLTEEQNAQRVEKQRMSDQGIVSQGELKKEVVETAKDIGSAIDKKIVKPIAAGTANFFGRDTSKSIESIEQGLK